MRKLSQLANLVLLVMAAMAAMAQKIWDGTKWVAKSLSGMPTPAGAEFEDAFEGVTAQAAKPVTPPQGAQSSRDGVTPAPPPQPEATPEVAATALADCDVIEIDPILAKGKAAHAFACALTTLDGEPPTEGLNEAEIAWLNSLNTYEMMHIWRGGPMQAGAHMAGIKFISGLPLCPTLAEYRHILGSAAQISPRQRGEIAEYNATLDQAFEDMLSDPTFELKHCI